MNFEFNDDQNMLRDQARKFLEEQCTSDAVRKILDDDTATHDGDLWKAICDMGWTGAAIPEEFGGLGLGYLELCVIAEELGRATAPVPFSSSIYLAAEALLLAGSGAQKQNWLPKLASGEAIGTLAAAEGPGFPSAKTVSTEVSGGKLSGQKLPVPDGLIADVAIVLAKSGADALSLYLVDLNQDGVTRTAVETVDPTRPQAQIDFDGAAADLIGEAGQGLDLFNEILDRAAVLMAFEQIGVSSSALEMGVAYAKERFAFGRAIGSFQAVKHMLADMYVAQELARSNGYYGAWALSTGAAELPLAAATARVSATEAAYKCSKDNTQVHGGMGFTWAFDCHLYYRRANGLNVALGGLNVWKDKMLTAMERQNTPAAA